jgi:hypothetical protein
MVHFADGVADATVLPPRVNLLLQRMNWRASQLKATVTPINLSLLSLLTFSTKASTWSISVVVASSIHEPSNSGSRLTNGG